MISSKSVGQRTCLDGALEAAATCKDTRSDFFVFDHSLSGNLGWGEGAGTSEADSCVTLSALDI